VNRCKVIFLAFSLSVAFLIPATVQASGYGSGGTSTTRLISNIGLGYEYTSWSGIQGNSAFATLSFGGRLDRVGIFWNSQVGKSFFNETGDELLRYRTGGRLIVGRQWYFSAGVSEEWLNLLGETFYYPIYTAGLGVSLGKLSLDLLVDYTPKLDDYYGVRLGIGYDFHLWSGRKRPIYISNKTREKPNISTSERPPKFPPRLVIEDVSLDEPSGNNVLDGREKGFIKVTIKNDGKGEARNVELKLTALQSVNGLSYKSSYDVGNIGPHETKEASIHVGAKSNIEQAKASIRIEALEGMGFDATPIVFTFETEPFKKPNFIVAVKTIDDDQSGMSSGNNDGMIERGEAVEMEFVIYNKGEGDGEDIEVHVSLDHEGDFIYFTSVKRNFERKRLVSGDTMVVPLSFMIAKRYAYNDVGVRIAVDERYHEYGIDKRFSLPLRKTIPTVSEIAIRPSIEKGRKPKSNVFNYVDVDTLPSFRSAQDSEAYAVIIGIEKYKYAPESQFSNRDAVAVYQYAKSVFGIPEENIYLRVNKDATKGEFEKIFGSHGWLSRRVVPGKSRVIVYYSGHGATDVKRREPYLVPYDIDPNYPSTGVAQREIYEDLSRLGARDVFVFLDACFSGQSRTQETLLANARPIMISPHYPIVSGNITVFMASDSTEIALSKSEYKHGLFTYYLLKSFHQPSITEDGVVVAGELYRYIGKNVRKDALRMDVEQHPKLIGNQEKIVARRR